MYAMINDPFLLMASGDGGGSALINILFFAAIIVVMYFFMIRPQTKKAKKQRQFVDEVDKGDKVVTSGGIHGKIIKVHKNTFVLETHGKNQLKVEKSSISREKTQASYGEEED